MLGIVRARNEAASILRQQLVEPFVEFAVVVMARLFALALLAGSPGAPQQDRREMV